MKSFSTIFAAAALTLGALQAHAVPITYTFTADVSGNLAGVAFQNKALTVVLEGDTDNVVPGSPGAPSYNTARNAGLTGTFAISDVGAGSFSDPLRVYKSSSLVGFSDSSDIFWLFWGDSYDLTTDATVAGVNGGRQNNTVNTDLGILNITGLTAGTGSFTAALVQADVPEPATMALLGLGLTGVGLSRRRQSKKAA